MHGAALRFLIVEDQFLVARQLEMIVEGLGHSVTGIARRTEEACNLASRSEHDVAFIDISLADGSSGLDVADYVIRSCGTPVVFITANRRRLPGDLMGAAAVVEKPFTRSGIVSALAVAASSLPACDQPRHA